MNNLLRGNKKIKLCLQIEKHSVKLTNTVDVYPYYILTLNIITLIAFIHSGLSHECQIK